ncbi:RDD family protein [Amycolatopsis umgeniensis]|uniref:Putative RDD family membrane protein YckC n=1 Tax=Amycolatopsis umgeniensis TaxID=336628 RepID=A0A841B5F2_9PSEU|nr:RDD family protein [Amycolatopsis umgeniensis]MBB5856229.1 putative RDD family membrane protein YckC [Amycolatopsis umgeniensis]
MTTPYGQQPPGQQPPPGSGPPPGDGQPQSPQPQQPFGQSSSGEQPSPFGQQPPHAPQGDQSSPFGQQPQQPFGAQQQSPFGQQPQQSSPFGQQQGQPSPFGQPGRQAPFGQAAQFGPRQDYAHWGLRAGATLIDFGPIVVLPIIGSIISATASYTVGMIIAGLGYLAGLGWTIYNRWIQMGTTGQSLGKKVLKIKLVREADGQPIGPLMAFVRDLCHNLDGWVCGLGYLWPLWDQKKQTFADKILSTVVLPAEAAAPASAPFGQAPGFPAPSPSFPAQPAPFGQPQQPFGAQPQQPGQFGQPPQPSQPFGQQPQGTAAPSPESQPGPGFGEAEPTQVLRPGQQEPPRAPSGFDEAEPTQKITPEQLRQQLPGADGPKGPGTPQQ